jgi:hypothetical protein
VTSNGKRVTSVEGACALPRGGIDARVALASTPSVAEVIRWVRQLPKPSRWWDHCWPELFWTQRGSEANDLPRRARKASSGVHF